MALPATDTLDPATLGGDLGRLTPQQRDILIRTLAGEAEGEGPEGWAAVLWTILNRTRDNRWSDDPAEVAKQRGQFSSWNRGEGRNNRGRRLDEDSALYQRIGRLVDNTMEGRIPDPTGGATHFYAGSRAPYWVRSENRREGAERVRIGGHTFAGQTGNDRGMALARSEGAKAPSGTTDRGRDLTLAAIIENAPIEVKTTIRDRTSTAGMTQQALRELDAAIKAGAEAGLTRIEIRAGKGEGHLSHAHGTEWDIAGFKGDRRWNNAERVAVAEGARRAGADRFGLYEMDRGVGQGTLHIGHSGRGRPSATWGAGGRTSGPASRNFRNEADQSFSNAFYSQRPYNSPLVRERAPAQTAIAQNMGASPGAARGTGERVPLSYDERVQLQRELVSRGADIKVDGIWGPATRAAVEKYGLGQGDAARQTTEAVKPVQTAQASKGPTLNESEARTIQEHLVRSGYDIPVTGVIDDRTMSAMVNASLGRSPQEWTARQAQEIPAQTRQQAPAQQTRGFTAAEPRGATRTTAAQAIAGQRAEQRPNRQDMASFNQRASVAFNPSEGNAWWRQAGALTQRQMDYNRDTGDLQSGLYRGMRLPSREERTHGTNALTERRDADRLAWNQGIMAGVRDARDAVREGPQVPAPEGQHQFVPGSLGEGFGVGGTAVGVTTRPATAGQSQPLPRPEERHLAPSQAATLAPSQAATFGRPATATLGQPATAASAANSPEAQRLAAAILAAAAQSGTGTGTGTASTVAPRAQAETQRIAQALAPSQRTQTMPDRQERTLGMNSRGEDVRALQQRLQDLGYKEIVGRDDGYYGPRTRDAVKAFQRDLGFRGRDVDGVVGPQTRWGLANQPVQSYTPQRNPNTQVTPRAKPTAGSYYEGRTSRQASVEDFTPAEVERYGRMVDESYDTTATMFDDEREREAYAMYDAARNYYGY